MEHYTVEVHKLDRRRINGQRLILKKDHAPATINELMNIYRREYPENKRYKISIYQTFVTRTNIRTGKTFVERYDTPYYLSPSSETYWSA